MAALTGWALVALCLTVVACDRLALRARREAVARACHELRGPLTAASLAIHAAGREEELGAAPLAAVELELRRAAMALDDLSAALAGRRRVDEREQVDVCALVATQIEAWRAAAQAHGCDLRLAAAAPRGMLVRGDRIRLAQATGNVLANALEHGRGPVEVDARLVDGCVRIDVADRGPGLPGSVADLARRRRGGRGARGRGLAIAAEIAERHGGRLTAGAGDHGAHVSIVLPVAEADGRDAASRAIAATT